MPGPGRDSGGSASRDAAAPSPLAPPTWLLVTLLAVLFVAAFHPFLAVRWKFYGEQPRYSHCLLLPVVSALWIWERWARLRALPRHPSRAGLAAAAFGMCIYLLGRRADVNLLQHQGMLMTLVGLVWGLLGTRLVRALAFPLGYLFLSQPLPKSWDDRITLPLQGIATGMAERVFAALEWPVVRQGNVLQLPGLKLLVEESCSGIHSLYALVALGLAWGFLVERPVWLRIVLTVAAVPVAVAANAIRVIVTGVLAHKVDASYATGLRHETAGLLVFAIGLGLLLFVDWCLKPDEVPDGHERAP